MSATDHPTKAYDYTLLSGMNSKLDAVLAGQAALVDIPKQLAAIEKRLSRVESRLDKLEVRVGRVEKRLDKVEYRLGKVEYRLEAVEAGVEFIKAVVSEQATDLDNHETRLRRLEPAAA